jgi:hypothetical protein
MAKHILDAAKGAAGGTVAQPQSTAGLVPAGNRRVFVFLRTQNWSIIQLSMTDETEKNDQEQPSLGDLISLQEAAALSGLSYGHMRYLARNGGYGQRNWVGIGSQLSKQSKNTWLKTADQDPSPSIDRLGEQ